jgi:predicted metal-dependent phosphoesterase TrpH
VSVLAVTDHDTLGGVAAAMRAGRERGVRVVPGVELSVRAPSGSMHLLAYFGEPAPQPLAGRLDGLRAAREARAREIVRLLAEAGAPVSFEDVAARAAGPIGRPHLADAVVAAGHARDRQEAFDRYLADGRPAAVPHRGASPDEALALVAASGGAAVLAHPASLRMDGPALSAYVARLAGAGLRGVEVHRPDHAPERRDAYAALARRHGLVAAGGSDFHRPGEDVLPGDTGAPPLPPDAIDRLLAAAGAGDPLR